MTQPLLIEHDDGVDRVTLNRPDSLNALDPDMIDALNGYFERISRREDHTQRWGCLGDGLLLRREAADMVMVGLMLGALGFTASFFVISIACASTMIFLVPRRDVVVSEELIEKAEEEESGML